MSEARLFNNNEILEIREKGIPFDLIKLLLKMNIGEGLVLVSHTALHPIALTDKMKNH